ncbi:hypothetical protein SAMN02745121_08918, partial [Nannocystis exedens]
LPACADHAPSFAAFAAYDSKMSGGTGGGSTDGAPMTTAEGGTSASPMATAGDADGTDSGGVSSGETGSTTASDAELLQPRILEVDMPAKVHLAGPVAVSVTTEDTSLVRAWLDGVELEPFADQGDGVFVGEVPIFGAVDNGDHVLEVTASSGPFVGHWPPVTFTVSAPAPGGQAWAVLGPSGSTTRRVAVTPEDDVIEVGSVEVDGVSKPSIRKRSRANGSELWSEGTIVLDSREGAADAVAVLPDGRMWIAMNVKNANKQWQPRIVLLDAEGYETGVEAPTEPGATVRGIAADDEGGAFAVGFGGSGFGDMDIVMWRLRHDGVAVHSGKTWDYLPTPDAPKHQFDDLAFDVMIKDGVAWIAGASTGEHEFNVAATRGVLVQMDPETAVSLEPVIVAPPYSDWRDSMFLAIADHPDGAIVTGMEVKKNGNMQQITVQVYWPDGGRPYYSNAFTGAVAYGTGVAWLAHGVAVVSGVIQDGGVLRGVLYGRGGPGANFDHYFPGTEPSAANGLARTGYGQVLVVGERTLGGVRQARAARVHQ